MYYYIEPETSGRIGANSTVDTTHHPPVVKKLNFEFEGWLGDDLAESFPCFIISENLKNKIIHENLTGFELDAAEITKSNTFNEIYGNKCLPKFHWLKVTGKAGKQDFGISNDFRLVVSTKALLAIKQTKIGHAIIEKYSSTSNLPHHETPPSSTHDAIQHSDGHPIFRNEQ